MNKEMPSKHDWSRFESMTEEERHAAALSGPDAQPLTEADMARLKRTPSAKDVSNPLPKFHPSFDHRKTDEE